MILASMLYFGFLVVIAGLGLLLIVIAALCLILVGRKHQRAHGKKMKRHYIPSAILSAAGILMIVPLVTTTFGINDQPTPRQHNQERMAEQAPLYHALIFEDIESVRALLEEGADPNQLTNVTRRTYLGSVCGAASIDIQKAQLLIDYGADVNLPDDNDKTPLIYAVESLFVGGTYDAPFQSKEALAKPYMDMISFLLSHGADVNYKSNGYGTALYIAQNNKPLNDKYDLEEIRQEVIELLESYGAAS